MSGTYVLSGSPRRSTGTITATLNGNATNVTGTVALTNGGTGATTAASARTNLGAAASGANGDITSLTGLTTAISVAQGGAGTTSAASARTNLGAAASGANTDITSLANLTTLSTTGNVGIGSATPGFRLDVAASGAGIQTVQRLQNIVTAANNSGAQTMYSANRTTNGLTNVAAIGGMITDISASAYKGALVFSTANNAAPAERMRIDSNGNVGIGTTAPNQLFQVYGTNPIFSVLDSSGVQTVLQSQSGFGNLSTVGNSPLIFGTNNIEKVRILANGNVGIGVSTPTNTLEVNGRIAQIGHFTYVGEQPLPVNNQAITLTANTWTNYGASFGLDTRLYSSYIGGNQTLHGRLCVMYTDSGWNGTIGFQLTNTASNAAIVSGTGWATWSASQLYRIICSAWVSASQLNNCTFSWEAGACQLRVRHTESVSTTVSNARIEWAVK